MTTAKASKCSRCPIREKIREAEELLCQPEDRLDEIRGEFNMEFGENRCCDLDLALSYAIRRIQEAKSELQDLLLRRRLGLNFKRGRSWI